MATVRRVRRIVRKVDAWTVFKVSVLFWLVAGIGLVLGLVMFWSVVEAAGIPQKVTDFLIEITLLEEGSQPFSDTEQYFRVALFGSIVFAVMGTGITTLGAVMYNLVSDVVGGIEVIVLEETLATAPVVAARSGRTTDGRNNSSVDLTTEETAITTPG